MAITRVGQGTTRLTDGTSTTISTSMPTGVAAGDLLILEVATSMGPYDITDPAGWTLLRRTGDPAATAPAESALEIWWKAATGSDVAPTLAVSGATRYVTCIRAFRGVNTTSPFLAEAARGETAITAVHTAPAVTNTDAGAWGLYTLSASKVPTPHSASPGPGLVERVDLETGVATWNNVLYFAADTGGPAPIGPVTYSATGSATSERAVMWAAFLAPAGGAPTIEGATAEVTAVAAGGEAVGGVGGPVTVNGATATVVALGGARPVPPPPDTSTDDWPPDPYREIIRSGGYGLVYKVSASLDGALIAGAQDLRPTGGSITDTTKPGVRRVLNLNLAPEPGLYDLLSPVGTLLKVTAEVTYPNRDVQSIPMGVFDVDSERLSDGGGGLSVTAPDKWVRIQRARFVRPEASQPFLLVVDQIALLIQGALGANEPVAVSATSQAYVGPMIWEKDRDKAIIGLANSIGAWVFFDRDGYCTIADVPSIGASADWLIDASASGVLIEIDRENSRTDTCNLVVVESTAADEEKFATQYVFDADPTSPTYAGPDPLNDPGSASPFGVVPDYLDISLPMDAVNARQAGVTRLARVLGLASQVSLGSAQNPAMDAFHIMDVLPPRERADIPRVLERHIVDVVTHPLALGTAQTIEGRSTRAERIEDGS